MTPNEPPLTKIATGDNLLPADLIVSSAPDMWIMALPAQRITSETQKRAPRRACQKVKEKAGHKKDRSQGSEVSFGEQIEGGSDKKLGDECQYVIDDCDSTDKLRVSGKPRYHVEAHDLEQKVDNKIEPRGSFGCIVPQGP